MGFGMIMWNKNMEKNRNYLLDTDSFIAYVKTEDIYIEITKDV